MSSFPLNFTGALETLFTMRGSVRSFEIESSHGAHSQAQRAIVAEVLLEDQHEGIHPQSEGVANRRARGAPDAFLLPDSQAAGDPFGSGRIPNRTPGDPIGNSYHNSFLAFHSTPGVVLKASRKTSV